MDYTLALKQKLSAHGFDERQCSLVSATVVETFEEFNNAALEQQKKQQDQNTERLFGLLEKFLEKPSGIISLFKTNWLKLASNLIIALAILTTLILLSWKGILGTCEASTIFGGIVGYLLGKGS